jgi:transposase
VDARQVKLISNASVKTDRQDALRLANLLSVNLLPEIWVPPAHVRDLRVLVAHREALCKRRTIALNRIRSVLNRHNLEQPDDLLHCREWQSQIEAQLSLVERLIVADDLASLSPINDSIARSETEMARLSQSDPWRSQAAQIMQLSGFGIIHAMSVLGAIGDVARFDAPQKLGGYTGLYPSRDQSGQKDRSGRITKQGRCDLRYALVSAARTAVQFDPYWKSTFDTLVTRMHQHKALVAIARKFAEIIWHVLQKSEPAHHISDEQLAKKFLSIRDQLSAFGLPTLPSRFFIRQQLIAIGRRNANTQFMKGSRRRLIASEAELNDFLRTSPSPTPLLS